MTYKGYREEQSVTIDCERHSSPSTGRGDRSCRGKGLRDFVQFFEELISVLQAILTPIITKLFDALQSSSTVRLYLIFPSHFFKPLMTVTLAPGRSTPGSHRPTHHNSKCGPRIDPDDRYTTHLRRLPYVSGRS